MGKYPKMGRVFRRNLILRQENQSKKEEASIFAIPNKIDQNMAMLWIIIGLFVFAILCPFILPNKSVSKHEGDHVD